MTRFASLVLCFFALTVPGVAEANWDDYTSKRYGFSMRVPAGTKIVDKDRQDGWGVLYGEYDDIKLYACAQLGRHYTAQQIEEFGAKVTGIKVENWEQIDEGKTGGKWTWYNTAIAIEDGKAAVGIYGIGPRGSYLILMVTTATDYEANEADYKNWYESVKLHGGWEIFRVEDYGFTMLVPEGCKPVTKKEGDWGELLATHGGVKVYGLAKKGANAKAEAIEEVGINVTRIARNHWKRIEKGENVRGWSWYQTVLARDSDEVCLGLYGTGKGGSYMIVVVTSTSDYDANKGCYDYWYEHIHLD